MFEQVIQQIKDGDMLSRTGKIENIVGMSIEASGGRGAIGDICRIYSAESNSQVLAEVVGFKSDRMLLMPYQNMNGLAPGSFVRNTGRRLRLQVGDFLRGRIINAMGKPIDGLEPFPEGDSYYVDSPYINPLTRPPIRERVDFGVRAIDSTLTIGKGQRIGIFAGSGVGKSTLLNTLAPALHRETGQISQKLGRGRHTTREVEIFEICGGRLADTPGFASLEAQKLCRIPKDDLQHTFPEFGPYFGQCRFTGCSHRSETGCAVREAVEAGTISKTRYASYLAMYEEANARKEWEK